MKGHWENNRYIEDYTWRATAWQAHNKKWLVSVWDYEKGDWVIRDVAYDTREEAKAVVEALVAMR